MLLSLKFAELAGEDVREEDIDNIEKELLRLDSPNIWNLHSKGNMEIEMESEFDKFMIAVCEHSNEKIDEITVFRFYALLGRIKEKNRPKKQGNGDY